MGDSRQVSGTGDRKQEMGRLTGDRMGDGRQETGDRRRETGDGRQETGDRTGETGQWYRRQ